MLRLSLRSVLAHRLRFLLTTFAVVVGVGFVVGSFVVTDTLRRSVDQLFEDITGGVDVSVRAETSLGEGGGNVQVARGRIPVDLLEVVRDVDGVEAAEQTIGGYAQLVDLEGEPLTTSGAPFIGVSWGHEDQLLPVTLDVGRAPDGHGEVAIDRGTADDYGFEVGDTTTVLLANGTQPTVEIVGIFTFGEANNLLGARLTAFDVDVAAEIFETGDEVDTIDVVAAPGVDPDELAERLQAALPAGVEAVTGTTVEDEAGQAVEGVMDGFQNILLGFAAVAVFVSAFFINNTFSILVGQRSRQLALLRSLGASRSQVTGSVVIESLVVGLLASALGIGLGLVIATGMQAMFRAAGFGLPAQPLVLLSRSIVVALVVGVGVTVFAALTPARRAALVPPVEGMREGFVAHTASDRCRGTIGGAITAVGALLVVMSLFVVDGSTLAVALLLGLGALAVFIGVAQLSPVVAVPLAGFLGRPVMRATGVTGRLAHFNALRNPDRTAKTGSALMIGLALVTTVFVVGASMKETFARTIEDSVSADYVLTTAGYVGFSPTLTEALAELPELEAVTGVRTSRFLIDGHERDVVAIDGETAGRVVDVDPVAGDVTALDERSILLHEDPAEDLGLAVGDTVTVELATGGPMSLQVVGIYADASMAGNYLIDMRLFTRHYPASNLDMMAFAKVADGVEPEQARSAIDGVLAQHPQVQLDDRAAFQADQEAEFDNLLIAVNGLLGLALLIALLGIANTLALSVLERTREIGLLRAVGMMRRQARQMVLLESGMVAVFGSAIGVAVGLLFGVALTAAMPASLVSTTVVPVSTLVVVVGLAALCGVIAGLPPARRAARLDVLRAVASD